MVIYIFNGFIMVNLNLNVIFIFLNRVYVFSNWREQLFHWIGTFSVKNIQAQITIILVARRSEFLFL